MNRPRAVKGATARRQLPRDARELLARARALGGCTVAEVAAEFDRALPPDLRTHKGWIGELVECALGARGGSRPEPDFAEIGIELKTIPLTVDGRPRESTHVCAINLATLAGQQWETSLVRRKLAHVLWMPLIAGTASNLAQRRFGRAWLWQPTAAEEDVLRQDWEEHMELLTTGRFDRLDARLGSYLQVRPKAADGRALTAAADSEGSPSATLPRGFYLRPGFTRMLVEASLAGDQR